MNCDREWKLNNIEHMSGIKKPDVVLNGIPPFFEATPYVFYITRGREPQRDKAPVTYKEWRSVCRTHPLLSIEEVYIQNNIDNTYIALEECY